MTRWVRVTFARYVPGDHLAAIAVREGASAAIAELDARIKRIEARSPTYTAEAREARQEAKVWLEAMAWEHEEGRRRWREALVQVWRDERGGCEVSGWRRPVFRALCTVALLLGRARTDRHDQRRRRRGRRGPDCYAMADWGGHEDGYSWSLNYLRFAPAVMRYELYLDGDSKW